MTKSNSEKKESKQTNSKSKTREKENGDKENAKKKEYFSEELKRLRQSLHDESEKIQSQKPAEKEFTPNTFNLLEPYCRVDTAEHVHDMPSGEVRHEYGNRHTAIGIQDPWVDHWMDSNLPPKTAANQSSTEHKKTENDEDDPNSSKEHGESQKTSRGSNKSTKDGSSKSTKDGSTRLPKFPTVTISGGSLPKKNKWYFTDVPKLREEIRQKTAGEEKRKEDYERTKTDFYRMELDKIEEYHPCNRSNMKAVYLAYLQNNRGSKKAVKECIRGVEEKENAQKAADSETKPKPKPETGSNKKKTTGSESDVRSESSEDDESEQRKGKNSKKKTTAGK